jgi:hypothetical protein
VPLDVALLLDTSSRMHAVQPAVKSGARALLTKRREGDRALVVDVKQRVMGAEQRPFSCFGVTAGREHCEGIVARTGGRERQAEGSLPEIRGAAGQEACDSHQD